MTQTEIAELLERKHQDLYKWLEAHPIESWETGPEGKWTTGQQVLHLYQSIRPLTKAMRLPKFFLKYKFGLSNRDTRSYDQVVSRYKERLANVQNVVSPFSSKMMVPEKSEKKDLIGLLNQEKFRLKKSVIKWKEADLDKYILPHPLMGRMPVREISMWTAYHTEHHLNQLKKNY